jgi:hypothetical protein
MQILSSASAWITRERERGLPVPTDTMELVEEILTIGDVQLPFGIFGTIATVKEEAQLILKHFVWLNKRIWETVRCLMIRKVGPTVIPSEPGTASF